MQSILRVFVTTCVFCLCAAAAPQSQPITNSLLKSKVTQCKNTGWNASSDACAQIPHLDTSAVTDMSELFFRAELVPDLSQWDTSHVTDMHWMFFDASTFNGDLSSWDTSSVTNMDSMFAGAESFNRNISNWATSSVIDMTQMFRLASAFNSDISRWDTSSVRNMRNIFLDAAAFDQDLCEWDISSLDRDTTLPAENPKLVFCPCAALDHCEMLGGVRVPYTEKCFFITDGSGTWDEAKDSCAQLGGTLASVRNEEEQNVIFAMWNGSSIAYDRSALGGMWLGARDTDEAGQFNFRWTDGTPAVLEDFPEWCWTCGWAYVYGNQQPNNFGSNQYCVSYGYSSKGQWIHEDPVPGWVDNNCELVQPAVCEVTCQDSSAGHQASGFLAVSSDNKIATEQAGEKENQMCMLGWAGWAVAGLLLAIIAAVETARNVRAAGGAVPDAVLRAQQAEFLDKYGVQASVVSDEKFFDSKGQAPALNSTDVSVRFQSRVSEASLQTPKAGDGKC